MRHDLGSSKHRTLAEYILRLAKDTDGFVYPKQIQEWLLWRYQCKTSTNTISVCIHRLKRHGLLVSLGPRKWCYAPKADALRIKLAAEAKAAARSYRQGRQKYQAALKRRQLREFNELLC